MKIMRILLAILVGSIGGFLLGIALSSMIGVIGMGLFKQPIGIKFLPYYTAALCAVIVPVWECRRLKKA